MPRCIKEQKLGRSNRKDPLIENYSANRDNYMEFVKAVEKGDWYRPNVNVCHSKAGTGTRRKSHNNWNRKMS